MSELDTADIKLEGITKLLQYPEYSDISDFRNLLGMLEQKEEFLDVITREASDESDIHVYIGTENQSDAMRNTALIFKKVNIGGKQFAVGVIGPKRMNYSKVIEMLTGLATGIDKIFGEAALPPGKYEE
jgi:heat-inducible transcriptional repressor